MKTRPVPSWQELGVRNTWDRYKLIPENVAFNTLRQARRNGEMVVGGPGVIVEVDECHHHKRKYD